MLLLQNLERSFRIQFYLQTCQKCGVCCQNKLIILSFQDIWEIMTYYPKSDITQMISLYQMDDAYIDGDLMKSKYDPICLLNDENQMEAFYLGLKFYPIPGGQSTCHFYNPFSNGCRIHDHKPFTCRSYPYCLDSNNASLICYGDCDFKQDLNFKETQEKVQLIQDFIRENIQFRKEIKEWVIYTKNIPHNVHQLLNYIMNIRLSHPR
jgi:Fe-S-cluster containining protein